MQKMTIKRVRKQAEAERFQSVSQPAVLLGLFNARPVICQNGLSYGFTCYPFNLVVQDSAGNITSGHWTIAVWFVTVNQFLHLFRWFYGCID